MKPPKWHEVAVIVTLVVVVGLAAISVLGTKASGTFTAMGDVGAGPRAGQNNAAEKNAGVKQAPPEEEIPRKIIYTAKATLLVEDFDTSDTELRRLVADQEKAFIAHARVTVSAYGRRHGEWTIRVPADRLEDFFDRAAKLGEVRERSLDSQDITDQYFDRENRLKNKLTRQEALRQMLKESTAKKEDYLAVDRELNQVTQDIEADEGQLRLWRNLTALATIHLNVTERKDYVPPASPAFGTTMGRAFAASVDSLVSFGKNVVLVVVVLVPWLPVILLIVLPIYLVGRRARRSAPKVPPETPPAAV
jgi:hypothetical protein